MALDVLSLATVVPFDLLDIAVFVLFVFREEAGSNLMTASFMFDVT